MSSEVVSLNVRSKIAGEEQPVEVEAILDAGALREGDGCVRRFWIAGLGRPMYLGHLGKEEKLALVDAVRAEHARLAKKGIKAPPAESRWSL